MFMGTEFAQSDEWNHDQSIDWHLLEYAPHRGIQKLVRDLNQLLRAQPALHDQDFDEAGFTWLDWEDSEHSVFAWLRHTADEQHVICICNMTPVVREGYRVGAPDWGVYTEILNTDNERYGGSNVVNSSNLQTQPTAWHQQAQSLVVTLPPLSTIVLKLA